MPTGATGATGATGGAAPGLAVAAANKPPVGSRIPVGQHYVEAELLTDASTDQPTPTPLLAALPITTGGGALRITFGATFSMDVAPGVVNFIVVVDGIARKAVGAQPFAVDVPTATWLMAKIGGLAPGQHKVEIQWQTAQGTARIRPVTAPMDEHAAVIGEEVPEK